MNIYLCLENEERKVHDMTCQKEHRFLPEYITLPESQDNRTGDRHICAGCAYEEGLNDGLNGKHRQTNLSHLPSSQAGNVRHKGAIEAYNYGYDEGQRRAQ